MKIITWNCQGGLRRKTDYLDQLDADILVIQECEDPALSTMEYKAWAGDYLWAGSNKNKGIGVFPRKGHTVTRLDWNGSFKVTGLIGHSPLASWQTSDLELFIPFAINHQLTALAVWTKGRRGQAFGYIGQIWKYLQIHGEQLTGNNTIMLGDFNSNQQWDAGERSDGWWNHASVIEALRSLNLESLYHAQQQEKHGEESLPTYFHQRNLQRPYHIDYILCSRQLLPRSTLEIGQPNDWISISDHLPLMLQLSQ